MLASLGELLQGIETGKSFKCEERPPMHDEVGVVKVSAVTWGRYQELESKTCIDPERVNPALLIAAGDFLFSRANTIDLVGACVIAENVSRQIMLSDKILRFRFTDESHKYWVLNLLRSKAGRKQIEALSSGNQDSMRNIGQERIQQIEIPLPPRAEQTRIVAKLEELLSDLDAGVAELKAAQKKLAQYRQSLLKAAVEGALTAEWRQHNHPTETGTQLLERILTERRARWEARQLAKFEEQGKTPPKDWQKKYPEPVQPDTAELPELPEGWVWASLDMLGEIASGVAKGSKRDSNVPVREVPYLRVANVQRGYLDLSEVKSILATERDIEDLTLKDGDVLFNEGGDRDKLGRGWVWRDQVAECIHQNHVFRMRPYCPEMLSELISHHGNTFGKLWFQNVGKQTTNLASINMTMLRAFPLPIAPASEQLEILAQIEVRLDSLDRQERATDLAMNQSAAQRQNILRAAFSGQLVPQDPNDEPASVLLERIRDQRGAQAGAKKPRGRKAKDASHA
ncbi:restriction endonuclease subunit S [Zoogloea sp.]|uniref:restriction endonuclease subunit S n=1 Tax=Zoogloea sp. TaxID=49181 RepID=UPI0035B288CF